MKNDGPLELDMTLMEAIMQYFDYGLDPGSGGRAILMLDEKLAIRSMHELSRHTAKDMIKYVKRYFPQESIGSRANVMAWMESGGLFSPEMEGEQALYKLGHVKYNGIKLLKEACDYKPMR